MVKHSFRILPAPQKAIFTLAAYHRVSLHAWGTLWTVCLNNPASLM